MERHVEITDKIIEWLYEHSNGNVSMVVAILHDAQEIGILANEKELTLDLMEKAYNNRMELLHDYVEFATIQKPQKATRKKRNKQQSNGDFSTNNNIKIADLVKEAKTSGTDIVELLKKNLTVVEVFV